MSSGAKSASVLLFVIIAMLAMASPIYAGEELPGKNVLILHSYHNGYPWTDALGEGIGKRLADSGLQLNIAIEYMDAKRFDSKELVFPALKYLYSQKYGRNRPDLIILTDNNALDFILQYGKTLFPDVPVIFCGINKYEHKAISAYDNIGGVIEDIDIPGTIALALSILPQTRSLLVLSDDTNAGRLHLERFRKEAPAFAGKLEISESTRWSWAELAEQLKALPGNSIVLQLSAHMDNQGVSLSEKEVSAFMKKNCRVPIFTLWDVMVGPGVMGGLVTSARNHGRLAADLAVKLLNGDINPDSIPLVNDPPNLYLFDYNELKRFKISESQLPLHRSIVNRPFSIYHQYRGVFISIIAVFILLVLLIAALATILMLKRRIEHEKAEMEAHIRHQQKLESIGTLAGGVAHEINNPINIIMNYGELIKSMSDPGGKIEDYSQAIIEECERVAGIVRNLLSFARQDVETHRRCDMRDVIGKTLSLTHRLLYKDSITLTSNIEDGLPEVVCNAQHIMQVLMNLITNARDALNERYPGSDENKVINISCHRFEKDGRPWLRTTVEDYGPGIPPAIRERIFDPFYTTKPRDKGTGLGLSVSHGIIKEHHGTLSLDSRVARYTRFYMDLPLDERDDGNTMQA